jgi:hypothetical protein
MFNLLLIAALLLPGYNRAEWGRWVDEDRDCQTTRDEVLIRDSLITVTFKSPRQCKVKAGLWRCPYTGRVFTNPRKLDIDHVVPLVYAHNNGGAVWPAAKKKCFSNDMQNLLAVYASANRSKGGKSIKQWRPQYNKKLFSKIWKSVKVKYRLN